MDPVSVSQRRVALRWDGNREEAVPASDTVYHRLPGQSPVFTVSLSELETSYLSLDTPNISVTWQLDSDIHAYDALLQIDSSGYEKSLPSYGVLQILVEHLQFTRTLAEGSSSRIFTATVEHVPYQENRAHAEVWFCDETLRPTDWENTREMKKPPKSIRNRWRRTVMARVVDRWLVGEPPVAILPNTICFED